uniref:Protein kinase domain-containing protein n=1 Tax=Macrostomum lignano TaxID=282301 RepID=A0A1I8F522_9PLAT
RVDRPTCSGRSCQPPAPHPDAVLGGPGSLVWQSTVSYPQCIHSTVFLMAFLDVLFVDREQRDRTLRPLAQPLLWYPRVFSDDTTFTSGDAPIALLLASHHAMSELRRSGCGRSGFGRSWRSVVGVVVVGVAVVGVVVVGVVLVGVVLVGVVVVGVVVVGVVVVGVVVVGVVVVGVVVVGVVVVGVVVVGVVVGRSGCGRVVVVGVVVVGVVDGRSGCGRSDSRRQLMARRTQQRGSPRVSNACEASQLSEAGVARWAPGRPIRKLMRRFSLEFILAIFVGAPMEHHWKAKYFCQCVKTGRVGSPGAQAGCLAQKMMAISEARSRYSNPQLAPGLAQRQRVHLPLASLRKAASAGPTLSSNGVLSASYINGNLSHLFPRFELTSPILLLMGKCGRKNSLTFSHPQFGTGSAAKAFMNGRLPAAARNKALPAFRGRVLGSQSQIVADIAQYYYPARRPAHQTQPPDQPPDQPRTQPRPATKTGHCLPLDPSVQRLKPRLLTGSPTEDFEARLTKNRLTSVKIIFRAATQMRSECVLCCEVESDGAALSSEVNGLYGREVLPHPDGVSVHHAEAFRAGSLPERLTGAESGGLHRSSTALVLDPSIIESQIGIAEKHAAVGLNLLGHVFRLLPPRRQRRGVGGSSNVRFRLADDTAAALALNETMQRSDTRRPCSWRTSSFKAELFASLTAAGLPGLSRVKFDERGRPVIKVEFYQLRSAHWLPKRGASFRNRIRIAYLTRDLVAKYDPISRRISWIKELWFSGRPPSHHHQPPRWAWALSVAAVAVNFHYRKLRLIKMSSPLVNNVDWRWLPACATLSCIVMAANSQWSTSALKCWAQTGPADPRLLSRLSAPCWRRPWRVHRIFTNVKLRKMEAEDGTGATPGSCEVRIGAAERVASAPNAGGVALIFAWETPRVQLEALNDSKTIGVCVDGADRRGAALRAARLRPELRVILLAACIILCAHHTLLLVFGKQGLPAGEVSGRQLLREWPPPKARSGWPWQQAVMAKQPYKQRNKTI